MSHDNVTYPPITPSNTMFIRNFTSFIHLSFDFQNITMNSKKDKVSTIPDYNLNSLNVTTNVINLANHILKESFGDVVKIIANELMHWNSQTLGSLFRSDAMREVKAKNGHQNLCKALITLIQHNLVVFSGNQEDR